MQLSQSNSRLTKLLELGNAQTASIVANGFTALITYASQHGWAEAFSEAAGQTILLPAVAIASIFGIAGMFQSSAKSEAAKKLAAEFEAAAHKVKSTADLLQQIADGRIKLSVHLDDVATQSLTALSNQIYSLRADTADLRGEIQASKVVNDQDHLDQRVLLQEVLANVDRLVAEIVGKAGNTNAKAPSLDEKIAAYRASLRVQLKNIERLPQETRAGKPRRGAGGMYRDPQLRRIFQDDSLPKDTFSPADQMRQRQQIAYATVQRLLHAGQEGMGSVIEISGEVGVGKSELLKTLAYDLADDVTSARIPIAFDFRRLRDSKSALECALESALGVVAGNTSYAFSEHDLVMLVKQGRLVLLVDEVDFVQGASERQSMLFGLAQSRANPSSLLHRTALILAGRPWARTGMDAQYFMHLGDFSEADVVWYILQFFHADEDGRQVAALYRKALPAQRRILQRPLFLYLLCRHVQSHREFRLLDEFELMTEWRQDVFRRRTSDRLQPNLLRFIERICREGLSRDGLIPAPLLNKVAAECAVDPLTAEDLVLLPALASANKVGMELAGGIRPLLEFMAGCDLACEGTESSLVEHLRALAYQPAWHQPLRWMCYAAINLFRLQSAAKDLAELVYAAVQAGRDDVGKTLDDLLVLLSQICALLGDAPEIIIQRYESLAANEQDAENRFSHHARLCRIGIYTPATARCFDEILTDLDSIEYWVDTADWLGLLGECSTPGIDFLADEAINGPSGPSRWLATLALTLQGVDQHSHDAEMNDLLGEPSRSSEWLPAATALVAAGSDVSTGINHVLDVLRDITHRREWFLGAAVLRSLGFAGEAALTVLESHLLPGSTPDAWAEAIDAIVALETGSDAAAAACITIMNTPERPSDWAKAAHFLGKLGRLDQKAANLLRTTILDISSVEMWERLAWALHHSGIDCDDLAPRFHQFLNSSDEKVQYASLGMLRAFHMRSRDALQFCRRALEQCKSPLRENAILAYLTDVFSGLTWRSCQGEFESDLHAIVDSLTNSRISTDSIAGLVRGSDWTILRKATGEYVFELRSECVLGI